MNEHINTLRELRKVFCLECKEREKGIAICCIERKVCPYIISLNYAIEMLEAIQTLTENNKKELRDKHRLQDINESLSQVQKKLERD